MSLEGLPRRPGAPAPTTRGAPGRCTVCGSQVWAGRSRCELHERGVAGWVWLGVMVALTLGMMFLEELRRLVGR